MNWEAFFLVCFGVGLLSTLVSFVAGALHLHLPTKFHAGHHGHVGSARMNLAHVSAFNLPTVMAFLAWFGGMGYMMSHNFGAGLAFSLLIALLGGTFGGVMVYKFLAYFMAHDGSIDPADDEMIGVVATVDSAIRPNGTGEIIYLRRGTRHTCSARAENGLAMAKNSEVVITRFEHGIAYVRHWEEFAGNSSSAAKA